MKMFPVKMFLKTYFDPYRPKEMDEVTRMTKDERGMDGSDSGATDRRAQTEEDEA